VGWRIASCPFPLSGTAKHAAIPSSRQEIGIIRERDQTVDRSVLPSIFALAVFIAGFRPLARRLGTHANLWFLGWGLLLVNYLAELFPALHGWAGLSTHLIAAWSIDLCGLVFVVVTANVPTPRMGRRFIVALAVPVLVQSTLGILDVQHPTVNLAACLLYLAPGIHLLTQRWDKSLPNIVVSIAYAVFGIAMVTVVPHSLPFVTGSALALVFLCAAYFYLVSAQRYTRGVIAAIAGLAGWGLSYPILLILQHYFPDLALDRTLVAVPRYLVVAGVMVTLLEEHVERTERMAMHDPLTDLPNRRLFEQRLIATMEEARINRTTVACLVIDVDNFKTINDTLGHSAGDQLLRALAVRLSWHMSPRDILARTGGDEFTALLAGVNDEHHLRFIAGAMMSAGSVPIVIDGKPVDMHISIGIALSPDHADDIDSLRRAADEAMYTAKRKGGAMLAFADED
jgi:diguanylate cyclase (GGDEF)-like protein